jgi:hypothetical protein
MISRAGDTTTIKSNIEENIKNYINSIPPKENMELGVMNRIGIDEIMVDFFNILRIFVNNEEVRDTRILQTIETKFIFEEIVWS